MIIAYFPGISIVIQAVQTHTKSKTFDQELKFFGFLRGVLIMTYIMICTSSARITLILFEYEISSLHQTRIIPKILYRVPYITSLMKPKKTF